MTASYALPPLGYDYAALEPHLSARIMELHHSKHHRAYVEGANAVIEQMAEARGAGDFGALADAIGEHVGGFAALKAQMTQATVGVQGSGWAVLSWDPYGQRLLIEQVENHQSNTLQAATPLLAIDAWEHAYYLQYENRGAEYASAIWNVVDWDDVARRFAEVSATALAEVGPGPGA